MIAEITFPDRSVSYSDFIRDLAAKINTFAKEDKDDPAYISQRKAEALYGKANVLRWRKMGAISPICRPGKIEYPTVRLKELSRTDEIYIRWMSSKQIERSSPKGDIRFRLPVGLLKKSSLT